MTAAIEFADLVPDARVAGLSHEGISRVISTEIYQSTAAKVVYQDPNNSICERIVYSDELKSLSIVNDAGSGSYSADGGLLRLAIEAYRIEHAYQFDPYLAINSSIIQALPHQITAVYDEMLPKQPLRFLLADDPGAGKTIMAGLLIKELIARDDVYNCLVVAPGNLVEQWQDELSEKFNLNFHILPSQSSNAQSSKFNPFDEQNLLIVRLDMLARNTELQKKLNASEWDLVVVDEAHRMSASFYRDEVRATKRYRLGELLAKRCRHFLLMSATPHNGKEEEYQLFLALLDEDRFASKSRDKLNGYNTSDIMRRLTKEELVKFDKTPLFPERRAQTIGYKLSNKEMELYDVVTDYVRNEMNRVERFATNDAKKRTNVGFALQILQRRLASSPKAIFNSLTRRKLRLTEQLYEARDMRTQNLQFANSKYENLETLHDIDEYEEERLEELEETVLTYATSAMSIDQLEKEVKTIEQIERQALDLLSSGEDTKWRELKNLLNSQKLKRDDGSVRKLIIFTEAKDTLLYLEERIKEVLRYPERVAVIHGGVGRENRREIVRRFQEDHNLEVLIANDAAGEGINLQSGNLMVNYDLPWNPNKIEQRFGRIHRIGQTKTCYLWNLVAEETREGEVYALLLRKLEAIRSSLQGRVFDIFGELFDGTSLKDLLWKAIQQEDNGEHRRQLRSTIDNAMDQNRIEELLNEKKLTDDVLTSESVGKTELELKQAEVKRLQPIHLQSFFIEALRKLGGKIKQRDRDWFEVTHLPVSLRTKPGSIGLLPDSIKHICFRKDSLNRHSTSEFITSGHPLLKSVLNKIRNDFSNLMDEGAVMIDETDRYHQPRTVFLVEHSVKDETISTPGNPNVISTKLEFFEFLWGGGIQEAGDAPHLDLRPATNEELEIIRSDVIETDSNKEIEQKFTSFSVETYAKKHLDEVLLKRLPEIEKIEKEVRNRLVRVINYWDLQATKENKQQSENSSSKQKLLNAQRQAAKFSDRLKRREQELNCARNISALSPIIRARMLVVPYCLVKNSQDSIEPHALHTDDIDKRKETEAFAMAAVMETERGLGFLPTDVSKENLGYDILSVSTSTSQRRYIEVKGRIDQADTVSVTRNEVVTSLQNPDEYILAIVQIANSRPCQPRYVRKPFNVDSDFDVSSIFDIASIQFKLKRLLERSETPK